MPDRCCGFHGEWCPGDALIFGACCDTCPDNTDTEDNDD